MNQSHYPDLDRCKKLKDIGFLETEKSFTHNWWPALWYSTVVDCEIKPSVMEMSDVIPNSIRIEDRNFIFTIRKFEDIYSLWYENWKNVILKLHSEWTLPNALADMVIWLVENKYLTFNK